MYQVKTHDACPTSRACYGHGTSTHTVSLPFSAVMAAGGLQGVGVLNLGRVERTRCRFLCFVLEEGCFY